MNWNAVVNFWCCPTSSTEEQSPKLIELVGPPSPPKTLQEWVSRRSYTHEDGCPSSFHHSGFSIEAMNQCRCKLGELARRDAPRSYGPVAAKHFN